VSRAKEIGDIAEALVNYQLSSAGLAMFAPSASHLPYDLLADVGNGRFLRIQVKGASQVRPAQPSYVFNVITMGRKDGYCIDDLDWFAFAALDLEQVLYVPAIDVIEKNTRQFSVPLTRFQMEAEASKRALIEEAQRVRDGLSFCEGCGRLASCAAYANSDASENYSCSDCQPNTND